MAHFAKVENNIVTEVIVAESQEWCDTYLSGTWIQTSYNTYAGEHRQGGTPLRKNYAGIGFTYDSVRDVFIPPKCHNEAEPDEATCRWTCSNSEHIVEE